MYMQTNNDVIKTKYSGNTKEGRIVLYLKINTQYRK